MSRILSETALNKKVLKQLSELQLGDLVEVTWLDASKGSKGICKRWNEEFSEG
jgi:ribosomal protein L3